jgi:hypothetical protein
MLNNKKIFNIKNIPTHPNNNIGLHPERLSFLRRFVSISYFEESEETEEKDEKQKRRILIKSLSWKIN